ncbi:MAG: DUF4835 family protein [Bacteroidales bacterium]|nr:DUF4835 family protein [Bacteroidales bacterium]
MIRFIIAIALFIYSILVYSQELKCNVQVIASEIQGTNTKIFQTMQSELYEFINNRNWTNHVYTQEERIECNLLLRILKPISTDEFEGQLQIQSRRPVFNSSYQTTLFNYLDKDIRFRYVEFEPLEFSETEHLSNLTSIIAYYIYIILGFDYDSFSFEGGTQFFQIAEKIVNNAQNAVEIGWKSYESNKSNRYWLIENILNDKYGSIREFMYNYHRLGLDRMYDKVNEGRLQITEDLLLLRKVYREKPNIHMPYYDLIFDAKADEFVNIYTEAFPDEKARVLNILNEIDPSNTEKYKKILSSN